MSSIIGVGSRDVKHKQSVVPVSVAAATHLEHDRRSAEVEFLPQLVLQITFVRKVEVHGMVDREDERRRVNSDLRGVKQLYGVAPLGRLRGVRRGGPPEEPVQR